MAAINAVASLQRAGDHAIVTDQTFGGTSRLFDEVLTRYDLSFTYVDTSRSDLIEPAITSKTRLLFVETPANPLLSLTDLARAATIAHTHGLRLVVDNTFASPYIQRPIELGADIVVPQARPSI